MQRRRAITILLLSVAARSLWSLDANPLLFIYDIYVTTTRCSIAGFGGGNGGIDEGGDGDDDGRGRGSNSRRRRRVFPPGTVPTLEGKTVWITGASSGIGAELAIQLAHAGVGHLVLSGRRGGRLEHVARSCRDAASALASASASASGVGVGGRRSFRTSIVAFDMSGGPDVLDAAVSEALLLASASSSSSGGSGGIDVLVLNAGRYQCGPALETDLDALVPELMRINFVSPVLLSQKLILADRWREKDGRGHVVAVSSLMGRGTSPLNSVYSATKHALRAYFLALAAEERSWLRVDVVLPGAVDTGLWDGTMISATIGRPPDDDDDDAAARTQKPPPLYADDRSKMSVRRCARLIVSSMIGPNCLFYETWVTLNPGLLWVYTASYMPNTFHLLSNIVAPLRMNIWRERGEDALYLPTLLSHLWGCVADYLAGRTDRLLPA